MNQPPVEDPFAPPHPARPVPALVLGSGVTALGVIRALGRKRIPAVAAAPGEAQFERWSRWHRPADLDWKSGGLEEALRASSLDGAVLVPCSDHAALEVSQLPPDLRSRFPSSLADASVLAELLDKARLSALLERLGLEHARTWLIDSFDALRSIDEHHLESAFLKPRDTQRFMGEYGVKSFTPRGRAEIWAALTDLRSRGLDAMLQEYVPGPATNGYLLDGFVDAGGTLRALLARQRLRMHPPDFGSSSAARTIPLDEAAPAVRSLERLLDATRYRGMFNVEFKKDTRDGSFRLLDVNPRAWWHVEFAARCGVDVVEMAYRDALGLAVESVDGYDLDRTVIYPYFDLFACLRSWRAGNLGLGRWARSWLGADQMIFAKDDPGVFMRATARLWGGYLARRLPFRRVERGGPVA